jgi:2-polyprenyl-6-hydroxyphenyl methylase/3-demethylubiquinone-9 3-methyltransferase
LDKKKREFSFGENWYDYTQRYLSDERIGLAKESLSNFLGMENLKGKSFLDIGCGSGVFSFAAHLMGAGEITSFDVDTFSIKSCEFLSQQKAGNPKNWNIVEGSILDETFVRSLNEHDIVYSWGVLHHTGDMWSAIRNASKLVKPNGLFFIAIYNKRENSLFGSKFWLLEKRLYNRVPVVVKRLLELGYMTAAVTYYIITFRNPIKQIKEYKTRGMSWYTDIKDWLGGYPYEFATPDEITGFCEGELGLKLVKIKPAVGLENSEFLFKA